MALEVVQETDPLIPRRETPQKLAIVECLFYCFSPILFIILITIATIYKITIDYYAVYTDINLNIVAALIFSAGCIGILMLLTRWCIKKAHVEVMCFVIFGILLIVQIIAAIYGCVQSADVKHYLRKSVERNMTNIFSKYYKDKHVEARFNTMQNELECCGVYSYKDYKTKNVPRSCCSADYLDKLCHNDTKPYDSGCLSKVYEQITFNVGVLSYVTSGLIGLQIFCGVLVLLCKA